MQMLVLGVLLLPLPGSAGAGKGQITAPRGEAFQGEQLWLWAGQGRAGG